MQKMSPEIAMRPETESAQMSADELRSRMYADHEFLEDTRQGWEEELRDEGMTLEEYRRSRHLD
jgi:hypothetical protein